MVSYTLGNILKVVGGLLCIPLLVSLIYMDGQYWSFLIVIGICLAIGFSLTLFLKPKKRDFFVREGFALTGVSWIVISLIGCLPFVLSGQIPNFVDALFETVSGFTTTGASILSDVEALAPSMLFWRSFTHWIGGMGILVFVLAFLPSDAHSIHILKAESPGPKVGKLVSKIKVTARILYMIYAILTLIEVLFLVCGGMKAFDAFCNAFGTAGTGGFSVINEGIGGYSTYSQVVIGVFMILFGVNFNVYYLLLLKKFSTAFKSEELRWYLIIIACSICLITTNLCIVNNVSSFTQGAVIFKDAFFQVGSIITTTGFATTDFSSWPAFSKFILFILMFVGACAGSTGGGVKVSRVVIMFKKFRVSLRKLIHPHAVTNIKFEDQKIEDETVNDIMTYVALIFAFFLIGTLIISVDGYDFETNASAVAACLNNIGPGLSNIVGPYGNYGGYSIVSKLVLTLSMLLGRLEIFPILVLFNPKLWKKN